MTQGKEGLVRHSQRVHSIVYNSPQIAAKSSQIHWSSLSFPPSRAFLPLPSTSVHHTRTHTHAHTLLHSSCTLWSGNQAASNCNNWKNVPSGLFEHLLALNFSHDYRLYVLCHTIWCVRACVCVYMSVYVCIRVWASDCLPSLSAMGVGVFM